MVRTNKVKFLVDMSSNIHLKHQVLSSYTSLFYKDFAIGSMFHSGDRKNKFSINAIEGSEFEAYLKGKVGATVKSDTEGYKVAWLDLSKDADFEKLEEIVVELPKFEKVGLRKLYEQH
ncbi:hypothetical protein [Bacillus pinisoli]|uniref:hypothetical protein n=1 Tax=Bacillus pinisoli TaxID=2901866 RepID=UPI001FF33B42|nr:hypothetical protein [Bacillus pinisoli]